MRGVTRKEDFRRAGGAEVVGAARERGVAVAEVSHLGLRWCLVGVMGLQARHNERWERPDGGSSITDFESFFRDHYRTVVRLACSVVGDSQGAQDVAQDVFLAAYRRFPANYEQAAGWVRVAAVHAALDIDRGERRRDRRQLLVQVVRVPCQARRTR